MVYHVRIQSTIKRSVPFVQVVVTVHRFLGDKTGRVHLRRGQRLLSEVVESESNMTEAPCSYLIDSGAELHVPTELRLHGIDTHLDGLLQGSYRGVVNLECA